MNNKINIINDAPNAPKKNNVSSGGFGAFHLSLAAENADRQNRHNTKYPRRVKIDSGEKLSWAAEFDHCAPKLKQDYRKDENFSGADVLFFDVDNGYTEDPNQFVWPRDIIDAWPDIRRIILSARGQDLRRAKIPTDISQYLVPSRNNMKEKDGKAARPKFHVYCPLGITVTDGENFKTLLNAIIAEVNKRCGFELFDKKHTGASRFFFANTTGKEGDKAIPLDMARTREAGKLSFDGEKAVSQIYTPAAFDVDNDERAETAPPVQSAGRDVDIIPQGKRNNTMFKEAGQFLRECGGDRKAARALYDKRAEDCRPSLPKDELDRTFESAVKSHIPAPPSAKRKKLTYIKLHFDSIGPLEKLSPSTQGNVILAVLKYGACGEIPSPVNEGVDAVIKMFMAQVDRDRASYNERCAQNSQNIKKRWGTKKKNTTVYERIRRFTKRTKRKSI
jgi:hypothetical protein